ncbi:MAG TPA: exonuclease domain-containing protein [Chitinophagales bacterium]|nr:exonuclease domain-containing protein [Chitinophagales bacterium]
MFAIVDTETTGGNPVKDRIMEIAIVLHDGEKVVEEFSTLINPQTPISPFIISLTGINDEMVASAPTFEEIAGNIMRITDKCIFVAHNARFDYSVLRREFKRMGIRFQRKQLCTVHLSQKLLPGQQSYSLGKLCRGIGIQVEKRHRALGDARATTMLFEKLLSSDREHIINSAFVDELEGADIPVNLSRETVDDLPEETGIYYFLDEKLRVLYVGKSRNIRKRVIDQILNEMHHEYAPMKNLIYDVAYEITGSELVAQLMEFEEIAKSSPPFNFTRRKKEYRFGIYHYTDENGYINLSVGKLNEHSAPLIETASYNSSMKIIRKLVARHQLDPRLSGLAKPEGVLSITPQAYNQRVSPLLRKYQFDFPNFFIIGEGRSHHEQSVVWVENQCYRGFGYFEPENIENDIRSLKEVVKPSKANSDAHRLIKNWLKKKMKDEVIRY